MIEHNILHNLITNDEYARKTLPFIRTEFFSQPDQKILFRLVNEYFEKYNSCPNKEALRIELNDVSNVDQTTIDNALQILNNPESEVDEIWLLDQTERFWWGGHSEICLLHGFALPLHPRGILWFPQ